MTDKEEKDWFERLDGEAIEKVFWPCMLAVVAIFALVSLGYMVDLIQAIHKDKENGLGLMNILIGITAGSGIWTIIRYLRNDYREHALRDGHDASPYFIYYLTKTSLIVDMFCGAFFSAFALLAMGPF